MTKHTVERATAADKAAMIDTLTLAFSADPAARWSWPESDTYLRAFPRFAQAFGGAAFEHGSAHRVNGCAGAALWLPPDVHPDEETMDRLMEETVAPDAQKDAAKLMAQMAGYHPEEPHWYLPLIGIDPAKQGHGHGGALMRHALAICDRDRIAAYLESSNTRNVPFYERLGFEVLGTIQVGGSPTIVPMLRKPGGGNG
jgi:ribosomal protein S18 acetylase RimI-like enzyme